MNHIVFYSGGLGSWQTTKRVIKKYGRENTVCLFTDTLIEDEDLYRFLLESTQEMFGVDNTDLIEKASNIPPVGHKSMDARKRFLNDLAGGATERNPNFIWINDGRDPWEVFKDARWIGNSRIAQCSHELKQRMSRDYIEKRYNPENCVLYLGIDWSEKHRTEAPRKNWAPYRVEFPMCDEPYLSNSDAISELQSLGIKIPRLYDMGFSHNNCGGFCVRAGQGHFVNLLRQKPELFAYHEAKEQEMREYLGKDVSILRRQRKGVKSPLTLKQLRLEYEGGGEQIDMFDIGGCGCFVQDES